MRSLAALVIGLALLSALAACAGRLPAEARIAAAPPDELRVIETDLRGRLSGGSREPQVLHLLAKVLEELGQLEEAEALAAEASQLTPFRADLLESLGEIQLRRGKRFQALMSYNQAITIDGERLSAFVGLAIAQHLLGNDADARSTLERALKLEPRYFEAHYHLARILLEAGQSAAAEPHILEARRIRPEDAQALRLHVRVLKGLGRLDEARFLAAEGLRRDPRDAELLRELLDIYAQRQSWERVEETLGRLAPLGEAQPEDLLIEAELLAARGDAVQSRARLEELLHRFPRHPTALVALGRSLLRENRAAEALEPLGTAAEVAPKSVEAHYWLALAYFRQDQPLRGDLELQRAAALDAGHPGVRLLQVRRLLAERNVPRAGALLDDYLKANPADQEALLLRAEWQTQGGDYRGAEKTLQMLTMDDPAVRFARARLAYLQKGYRAVLEETAPLMAQPQPAWEAVYLRGAALGALGRYAEAVELLSPQMKGAAGNGAFHRLIGDLQRLAGDREAARRTYGEGLRLYPRHPGLLDGMSRLAIEEKKWQEAQGWLEAGAERESPLLPVFLDRLAQVYAALGDTAKAQQALTRYLAVTDPLAREGREAAETAILFRVSLPPAAGFTRGAAAPR